MSYAQQTDVLARIPKLAVTMTTQPSLDSLATFLAQRSSEIDAALRSRGLMTPVSTPAEFAAELVQLNAMGAAADMMLAAYITGDGNDRGSGAVWLRAYTDRLNQIRRGEGIPVGAGVAEADTAPRSLWTDAGAVGQTGADAWGRPVSGEPMFRIGARY